MARVLVIDDEVVVCRVAARALEDAGHQVIVATDGRSGLELLREGGADVVVVDLHMPEMDGFQVLFQLRVLAPALPAIAMSGDGRERLAEWFRSVRLLGPVALLGKPFKPIELQETVAPALRSRPGQGESTGQARA